MSDKFTNLAALFSRSLSLAKTRVFKVPNYGTIVRLLFIFLVWRLGMFFVAFLSPNFIKEFGGSFPYYKELLISTGLPPWIWGFGNFDGVHYLTIAQQGYLAQYTQAFFPLYPLLIKLFAFGKYYFLSGLAISNFFLGASLYTLYKLFSLDWDKKTSFKSLILLLAFPTAFYFGSVYGESLLLFFASLSLLFMRQKKFLLAGIAAALASAAKVFGLFLLPALAIELISDVKAEEIKVKSLKFRQPLLGIFLASLGTVAYMIYLKLDFNNPVYFLTSQPAFGAQRSSLPIVLLPQVLFRYLKIFMTTKVYPPPFFNAFLEFTMTLAALLILAVAFKKIRLSYFIFTIGCIILPTLTGTLSSMPRYILMSFLLFPFIVGRLGKYSQFVITLLILLEATLLSLFIRGYWIS